MVKNPDYLMSLKPSELKSLKDGEFRIYTGLKFEAIEKSVRELKKIFWASIIAMFSILVAVIMSIMY